jgi:hypothetical protein
MADMMAKMALVHPYAVRGMAVELQSFPLGPEAKSAIKLQIKAPPAPVWSVAPQRRASMAMGAVVVGVVVFMAAVQAAQAGTTTAVAAAAVGQA